MKPKKRQPKPIQAFVENRMVELQPTSPCGVEYPPGWFGGMRATVATYPLSNGERDEVYARPWSVRDSDEQDEAEEGNPLGLPAFWTADMVRVWLGEGMLTLKRLPAQGCFPGTGKTAWPEFARDVFGAYGSDDVVVAQEVDSQRRRPTILEVGRLDVVMRWPYWIADVEQRKAALFIAMGLSTRVVGRILGVSHESVRMMARYAFDEIARLLNSGGLTKAG